MDQASPAVRSLWRLLYVLEAEELDWRTHGRRRGGKQSSKMPRTYRNAMEYNSDGQRVNSINSPDLSRSFPKRSIFHEEYHIQKSLNISPTTSPFPKSKIEPVPALSYPHQVDLHRIPKNLTKPLSPPSEKIVDYPKVVSTNDLSTHDHKGWLIDHLKGTRVWCAVFSQFLCVFDQENSSASKHVIPLPGCLLRFLEIPPVDLENFRDIGVSRHFKVDSSTSGNKFQFFLENPATKQKYFFGTSSKQELVQWKRALDSARSDSPDAHIIKDTADQENCAEQGNEAQKNILSFSEKASENVNDQSEPIGQKSQQSEANCSTLKSKSTTPVFKIIKCTVPDDNNYERSKAPLPTGSPKLAPMKASHHVVNISCVEASIGKDSRRPRGLFKMKSPLDILFKRQERSHSADDVANRKLLLQQKNKEQGTKPVFTPPLDRKISISLNSSQCSLSSLGDDKLKFIGIPPTEQSQSSQRNKKSSLRHSRSFSQLTSGLKNSIFRHFSTKRSYQHNSLVKVRDLKDIRISGKLQCWTDNHTRQTQFFCAVSRGSFYLCRSDHRDETPEVVIRLSQCQVAYAPAVSDRLESLFAFTVKPSHGEELCFSAEDQLTVLNWMLVLQNEAAKVQCGDDLPRQKLEQNQPISSSETSSNITLLPDDTRGNSLETSLTRSQKLFEVNRRCSRLKPADHSEDYKTPRDVLLRRTKSDLDVVNSTEAFEARTSSFQSIPEKLDFDDGIDYRQSQSSKNLSLNASLYKINHKPSLVLKSVSEENTKLTTSKMPKGLAEKAMPGQLNSSAAESQNFNAKFTHEKLQVSPKYDAAIRGEYLEESQEYLPEFTLGKTLEDSTSHEPDGNSEHSSVHNCPATDTDQSSSDAAIMSEIAREPMTSSVTSPRPLASSVSTIGPLTSSETNFKSATLTAANSTCEISSELIPRTLTLSEPNLMTSFNPNSRSATSSEAYSTPSDSNTQTCGIKEYFFGSSVHDECLKAAWAMNEEFLLQAVKDKLRQRSLRRTLVVKPGYRSDGSTEDVCVVGDGWNVAQTPQPFTTVDAPLELGRSQISLDPESPSVPGEIPVLCAELKDKEGFLERLEKDETWHRYWCVLRKDYLQYYREHNDTWPSEVILLRNCSILRGTPSVQGRQCILHLTQRDKEDIVTLRADSELQYREWFESISCRLTNHALQLDSLDGTLSLDEQGGVEHQATSIKNNKLMSEVLKQRQQSRSPLTTGTGSNSEVKTDLNEKTDSSVLSLVSEEEKTCLITRLTRQRISMLIKLNAVQKQLEASSQYTQERKTEAGRQTKGKLDLLEESAALDRSSDLKEQVGMLSSQLEDLDRVLVSHGSTPQKSAPKAKVRGLLRHSFDHDLLQNLKLAAEANRRKQSDQSNPPGLKVKGQDVFRPVSVKTTMQKLALKTFDMASFYWRKRPHEHPDLEMKGGLNDPDSVNASQGLHLDSDVTDLTRNPQGSESPSSLDKSDVTDSPHLSRNGAVPSISRSLPGSMKREGNQALSKKIGSGLSPSNTETHSAKVGDPSSDSSGNRLPFQAGGVGSPVQKASHKSGGSLSSSGTSTSDGSEGQRSVLPSPRKEVSASTLAEIEAFQLLSLKVLGGQTN